MKEETDQEIEEAALEDIEKVEDRAVEEMEEDLTVEDMIEEGQEVEMVLEAIARRDGMKEVEEENPEEMDMKGEHLGQEKGEIIERCLKILKITNITEEEEEDQMEGMSILKN